MKSTHSAYASIPTGVAVAHFHLQMTVISSESWQARACVTPLTCIHAGGAVQTGMMMGAKVQV